MFSINLVLCSPLNRACHIRKAHKGRKGIDNEKKVSPQWDFILIALGFVMREYVSQAELQLRESVTINSNPVLACIIFHQPL